MSIINKSWEHIDNKVIQPWSSSISRKTNQPVKGLGQSSQALSSSDQIICGKIIQPFQRTNRHYKPLQNINLYSLAFISTRDKKLIERNLLTNAIANAVLNFFWEMASQFYVLVFILFLPSFLLIMDQIDLSCLKNLSLWLSPIGQAEVVLSLWVKNLFKMWWGIGFQHSLRVVAEIKSKMEMVRSEGPFVLRIRNLV